MRAGELLVRLQHLRDAKVSKLEVGVAEHEDVGGLEVAVQDVLVVQRLHAQAHLDEEGPHLWLGVGVRVRVRVRVRARVGVGVRARARVTRLCSMRAACTTFLPASATSVPKPRRWPPRKVE